MSHNFRTIVFSDCVGDRAEAPHEANLFDMGQKYADLMASPEVGARLEGLGSLPRHRHRGQVRRARLVVRKILAFQSGSGW